LRENIVEQGSERRLEDVVVIIIIIMVYRGSACYPLPSSHIMPSILLLHGLAGSPVLPIGS
jgi:hypothetical protein